jgi:hypothetical protein
MSDKLNVTRRAKRARIVQKNLPCQAVGPARCFSNLDQKENEFRQAGPDASGHGNASGCSGRMGSKGKQIMCRCLGQRQANGVHVLLQCDRGRQRRPGIVSRKGPAQRGPRGSTAEIIFCSATSLSRQGHGYSAGTQVVLATRRLQGKRAVSRSSVCKRVVTCCCSSCKLHSFFA